MQLVFLTNYYPPFARGGYEQWCQEVADALRRRGHRVVVLTSRPGNQPPLAEDAEVDVRRLLNLEVEGGVARTALRLVRNRLRREAETLESVQRAIEEIRPDAALIWGMWNVPRAVPAMVERLLPGQVAYYLCDYWLSLPSAYVQQLGNPAARAITRLPKRLVADALLRGFASDAPRSLRVERPLCVSQAVREILIRDGVPIEHARVIPGGIQVDDFVPRAVERGIPADDPLKLLYAGRLTEEKGVHTAVKAMAELLVRPSRPVILDIVGNGEPGYRAMLEGLIARYGLLESVRFREPVARSEMPALLPKYDVLLFPSEWQEPFARMVLEAMAVGLVVIGTRTGGTGDVLVEGKTGLTFEPGDASALARQIERVRDDRSLGQRLAVAGRHEVQEKFTFTRMVDEIEESLRAIARVGAV